MLSVVGFYLITMPNFLDYTVVFVLDLGLSGEKFEFQLFLSWTFPSSPYLFLKSSEFLNWFSVKLPQEVHEGVEEGQVYIFSWPIWW